MMRTAFELRLRQDLTGAALVFQVEILHIPAVYRYVADSVHWNLPMVAG